MIIDPKELKKIIAECKKSVGKESSFPILQNINFMKMEGKTLAWTSNFELIIAYIIEQEIERSFTVKLKDLEKYTKKFKSNISISVNEDNTMTIEDEKRSYTIEDLIDFGEVPLIKESMMNEILNQCFLLRNIDEQIKYCNRIPKCDRENFNGIFFENSRMIATDGFTIHSCKLDQALDGNYFITKNLLDKIKSKKNISFNMFQEQKEESDGFVYKYQWAIAHTEGFSYIDSFHEQHNAPAFDLIIPEKFKETASVNVEEIVEGAEGAFLKEFSLIILREDGIHWQHEEDKNSGTNKYHYKMNFSFLTKIEHVGMNGTYLINGLKNTSKQWIIKINAKDTPVVFESIDGEYSFTIMPMRVLR